MVGALSLFFLPAPLLMKQGYLIITGVAVAYVFTWIPEWTTWILLVAMAIYDIVAGGCTDCSSLSLQPHTRHNSSWAGFPAQ